MDHENAIESKIREEIKKLQIDNNKAMGNLVEKKVVRALLEETFQNINKSFITLAKVQAPKIAQILDFPDRIGMIEKILIDMFMDSVCDVIKSMETLKGPDDEDIDLASMSENINNLIDDPDFEDLMKQAYRRHGRYG